MNQFDPDQHRKILLNPIGGYEWSLERPFVDAKVSGGLGQSAVSNVGMAVKCLLVGFDEPAVRLLKKAREWVQYAIETNERPMWYFPEGTESSRFETLALCNWLLTNQHDAESLNQYVMHEDRYLDILAPKDRVEVSSAMALYVDAGAFARTLQIINSTPGLKAPNALSPRTEPQMAYILCQNQLRLHYSPSDVQMASDSFLRRNMNAWLTNGHYVSAAQWMKVLHWNTADRTLTPKQVILKCYDYLK